MAKTISGRVTKGPTPIILIMFSEIAPRSPIPRTSPSSLAMFGIFLAAEQELVFGSLLITKQVVVLGFHPTKDQGKSLGSHPTTEPRVPHISLVFREMWDTTNLNVCCS